jgi:anti-anti-sigma factor
MAELERHGTAQARIDTGTDDSGAPLVVVSGELDMSNADSLQRAVAAITADRPQRLVFDLSGVRFMDSAGIAVLVAAAAEAGKVQLRSPSPIVRRVVELTGLSDILAMEP